MAALIIPIVVVLVLLPCYTQARETAQRAGDSANLAAIGRALAVYADDHNGSPAPDLRTLLKDELLAPRQLIHATLSQRAVRSCDYNYVAYDCTQKGEMSPNWIVAYCDPKFHDATGASVLFVDGHVKFLKPPDFADMLAEFRRDYEDKFGEEPAIIPAGELPEEDAADP